MICQRVLVVCETLRNFEPKSIEIIDFHAAIQNFVLESHIFIVSQKHFHTCSERLIAILPNVLMSSV